MKIAKLGVATFKVPSAILLVKSSKCVRVVLLEVYKLDMSTFVVPT